LGWRSGASVDLGTVLAKRRGTAGGRKGDGGGVGRLAAAGAGSGDFGIGVSNGLGLGGLRAAGLLGRGLVWPPDDPVAGGPAVAPDAKGGAGRASLSRDRCSLRASSTPAVSTRGGEGNAPAICAGRSESSGSETELTPGGMMSRFWGGLRSGAESTAGDPPPAPSHRNAAASPALRRAGGGKLGFLAVGGGAGGLAPCPALPASLGTQSAGFPMSRRGGWGGTPRDGGTLGWLSGNLMQLFDLDRGSEGTVQTLQALAANAAHDDPTARSMPPNISEIRVTLEP
jgi:hypothetical protein